MTAEHDRATSDEDDSEQPTTRLSGAVMSVDRGRLRSALEMLAAGDAGDQPSFLLGLVELMMVRGSASPTGFEGWLDGSLVVTVRRRGTCGVTLHVGADNGERCEESFVVPFARLAFADICAAIEREPAIVGPAFVHADESELSILVVTYVEDDVAENLLRAAPAPNVIDLDAALRAQAETPTLQVAQDLAGLDPDATLIASPSSELLRLSVPPPPGAAVQLTRRRR